MLVKVVDDINVRVVDDPDHAQKYRGSYILWPNSARRDITMGFSLPEGARPQPKPFNGRSL